MAAAKLGKRDGGGLSLPEDIILEVLLRLPAKALRRFRCVSVSWRALISDPAFVAALIRYRAATAGPLIVAEFRHELMLRLLDKRGDVLMELDLRGGSRALLAPTRLGRILLDRGPQLGATIIDPASALAGTKKLRPPPSWANTTVVSNYSFGRATASGHSKVLRLAASSSCSPLKQWCHVATITDGGADEPTWRERPWGPFYHPSFSCEDKATANGVLYFMLYYSPFHGRHLIAAFDLDSEEWKPFDKVRGPLLRSKNTDDKCRITLTELKGALCLVHNVQYFADLFGHYADIWLLKDPDTCVWVKEYRIKMPPKRLLLYTKPLDVLTDGRLLLLNQFRKEGTTDCLRYILQLYNPSTKDFTDFMEMAPGFKGGMALYTGSLQA